MHTQKTGLSGGLDSMFGMGLYGDLKLFLVMMLLSVLIRSGIGLSPFSGKFNDNPPEGQAPWGDFECHRTWFEITHHLPPDQWYQDTLYSNTTYWPLDYPPLCAFWHGGFSRMIGRFEP